MNTETDSEDGGVELSSFEYSDSIEIEPDSAPTSASQSPHQSATSFANTLGNISPSVVEAGTEPPSVQSTSSHNPSVALPPLSHPQEIYTHNPSGLVSTNTTSFAEALSGELLSVPQGSGFHWEEDAMDTNETEGTLQAFPSSSAMSHVSTVQGDSSLESATSGQLQITHQHTLDWGAAVLPDTHHDPDISLPSLSDVFGSEFLLQTMGSVPNQPADVAEDLTNEEWADMWDDVEDSVRNIQCDVFFNHWKQMYAHHVTGYPPISGLAHDLAKVQRPKKISAEDLDPTDPEKHDFQGIHWSRFQTTKENAREVRRMTYKNHINSTHFTAGILTNKGQYGTPAFKVKFSEETLPEADSFFRFREANTRVRSYISHFQLRHNIFASSKNALFYNSRPRTNYGYGHYVESNKVCDARIMCFNAETSADECVMDFTKVTDRESPHVQRPSTLTAEGGVLVVGSFEGVYAIKSLSATFESEPTFGVITINGDNGSTNHIQNFLDRQSGLPQAAFSSNDMTIRILDCTTNTFVRAHRFPYQVNCSTISPDGRLRLVVGDDCDPIVANAETGSRLARLPGHTNFGFGCAWAPDGITMATGAQDGFVQVWDARNMKESLKRIPMEMAGSRTLQFSPLGSGKRVLVIAEPADFVHVVDAQTFESKQTIEFFGEIAGISMPPDGERLYVANQDETYGGLMEFERYWGKGSWDCDKDWKGDEDLDDDERVMLSRAQRKRRGLGVREGRG